jgi:hypothetical protein
MPRAWGPKACRVRGQTKETTLPETTYRIIAFGTNDHGFFNHFYFESVERHAYIVYQACLADPEFDGAVLIEVQHETWSVIEEFGTEGYSVVCGPVGNLKVEKTPELVLV